MGAALSDAAIASALRRIKAGGKTAITLADSGARGAGRLALIVKPGRAEWYAQRYIDGARKLEKLGAYPALTLEQAREKFKAPARKVGGATVAELFGAYADKLEAAGQPSARAVRILLARCAASIGGQRLAATVTAGDMVAALAAVYDDGAPAMADKMRLYMHAAYQWAIETAHDYRVKGAARFDIETNPAAAIPRDAEAHRAGQRWLSTDEFQKLLRWCAITNGKTKQTRHIIALTALTGQRIGEILRLRAENWNSAERILYWPTTKNGHPHAVPVCERAAALLDAMPAGGYKTDSGGIVRILKRFARENGMQPFGNRDLRRTFKTLAGQAGITREVRDLLQNHRAPANSVSVRHYDRYDQMREKRAAVSKWAAWLDSFEIPATPKN